MIINNEIIYIYLLISFLPLFLIFSLFFLLFPTNSLALLEAHWNPTLKTLALVGLVIMVETAITPVIKSDAGHL